jgi:hypothetical protein
LDDFFKILLEELELAYAYVGCCMVEYPLWLSRVLRAVGLAGDGEIGDFIGLIGDFSDRLGLAAEEGAVVEMLKDSLGFATREASILNGG